MNIENQNERLLKCFQLIDLKTGELTHQYVGQMDSYVRMRDDLMELFGAGQVLKIERVKRFSDKVVQYTSDLS